MKNPAAALKWVLQDPNVHTIVPGFTTFEQMNIDLAVMEDPTLTRSGKERSAKRGIPSGIVLPGLQDNVWDNARSIYLSLI